MKSVLNISLCLCTLVALAGCAHNFSVIKEEGRPYYLGTRGAGLHKTLCESGDLKRVLARAELREETKADIYKYNCLEPSTAKMTKLLTDLKFMENASLRQSFRREGYMINYFPCGWD
jgi:hypothetical protein